MTRRSERRTLNVLLVDDDRRVLSGLHDLLLRQQEVKSIVMANRGQVAIGKLPGNPLINVALIDVDMPGTDGIETARIIKDRYPGVAVVLMTAFRREEYVERAITLKISGLINKDMSTDTLVDALVQAVKTPTDPSGWPVPILGTWPSAVMRSAYRRQAFTRQQNSEFLQAIDNLSPKYQRIVAPLILGTPYKVVAERLRLSEQTVRTYGARLIRELGCRSRSEVAARAIQAGWTADEQLIFNDHI